MVGCKKKYNESTKAMKESTKPYTLNAKQIYILKLIYKFRFVTVSLLSRYKGLKRGDSVSEALEILLKRDYIGKRYDKSYKLLGKGAAYYLESDGRKLLGKEYNFNKKALHTMYSNNTIGEDFVDKQIDILRVCLALRNSYPNTFDLFTKTELKDYDYFPDPPPDLYVNRLVHEDEAENGYLLDVLSDTQKFVLVKRINVYIEHYESGDWEQATESEYPTILLVCTDGRAEWRLQQEITKILQDRGMDDEIFFYTTTKKALLDSSIDSKAVWSDVFEPEKLLEL